MSSNQNRTTGLLICTPTHSGQVTREYAISLLGLQRELDKAGIDSRVVIQEGSLLHSMRNIMASLLLCSPDLSHLLFVDADMGFEPDTVRKMIDANVDVIGAVYPFKKLPLHYPLGEAEPTESLGEWIGRHVEYAVRGTPKEHTGEVYEFEAIGTGLMLISKESLRRMRSQRKVAKYRLDQNLHWYYGSEYYGFFDYMTVEGVAVGEDYAFCRRWSELGGKIYGLVSEKIRHIGVNVVAGRFADHKSIHKMVAQDAISSSASESQGASSISEP